MQSDDAEPLDELSLTRSPKLERAPDGHAEIQAKLATLPSAVHRDYYSRSLAAIASTPDGTRYQFFEGALGMGAIYRVNGTRAIYGPILRAWADQHYELGWLGYPTTDAQTTARGVEQQFFVDDVTPAVENQGLLRVRRVLRVDASGASAHYDEVNEYLVSAQSGGVSSYPQDCKLETFSYPQGSIYADVYPGQLQRLWCGPKPADYYDENIDVDPGSI